MSAAEVIDAWRSKRPSERITEKVLLDIFGLETLRYADLRYADLRYADLRYANLWGADLRYADLRYADLRGANLLGANLRYADLWGANLRYANLWGANLLGAGIVLGVTGLPSGTAVLIPTCIGWELMVGCWKGSASDLRELIAQDDGWPDATGDEVARRRPGLAALADLADAHIAAHPGVIEDLAKRWGTGVDS